MFEVGFMFSFAHFIAPRLGRGLLILWGLAAWSCASSEDIGDMGGSGAKGAIENGGETGQGGSSSASRATNPDAGIIFGGTGASAVSGPTPPGCGDGKL